MRGIIVPDREEDFTADPVELFFDLVFVFAFSQLVSHLIHHPDWPGAGGALLLFSLIWMSWSQFTWLANAVSGNGRFVRAMFLLATVASVPMAASVTTAFSVGGPWFAWSVAIILALGVSMLVWGVDDPDLRSSAIRYAIPLLGGSAVLVVGSYLDGGARIVVWLVAVAIMVGNTVAAGSGDWIVRSGHFSERHGLIVIVALGEVIVATGLPVVDALQEGEGLSLETVATLVSSATMACLLWWGYFDRAQPALEHRTEGLSGRARGVTVRDAYTYAHLPLVGGIVLAAAGLEEIALHPADPVPTPFKLMLWAGVALYLFGVIAAIFRSFRIIPGERTATALVLGGLVALWGSLDGLYLVVAFDAVLLAMLVLEHARIEGGNGSGSTAATDTATSSG